MIIQKIGYRETGSSVALPVFKSFMEKYLDEDNEKDIDFFIPDNIILKKINPNTGIFETKFSIIEYFTKDQLETINNLNKVNTIGGIN